LYLSFFLNRHKPSHLAPTGLLRPLPVPHRPWSHISLDFVTGLPPSRANTVILSVVDHPHSSGKMAHLMPLPKLPSAKETVQTILLHVYRLHGRPVDVVSDRGPQFTSVFWKELCAQLGATVSLSSGFHPQYNGQTKRMNQEMETMLRCTASQNPSSWSQQLPWVDYAHNTLTSSASPPSSAPTGINRHSSWPWRGRYPVCPSRPSFATAAEPGPSLGLPSSARLSSTLTPYLGAHLPGRPEVLALYAQTSSLGGVKEAGSPVHWRFPHPEDNQPCGREAPAPARHVHPPHLSRLQSQTGPREPSGARGPTSSTSPVH